ncbi:MAG: phospholipid carrier-dependent glycosyltransferase, partial [Raineya sp.]
MIFLGVLLGQKWYQYLATLLAIIFTAKNTSASTWDLGYYFQYIFSFENAFLLIFIAIAFGSFIKNFKQTENFKKVVWLVFLGTFITMNLLAKAPRGLIFCLPLGYLLAFDWVSNFYKNTNLKKQVFIIILALLGFLQQVKNIFYEIYAYSPTNYPKVAQYLQKNEAEIVFSTLGLSIYPYLDKNVKLV